MCVSVRVCTSDRNKKRRFPHSDSNEGGSLNRVGEFVVGLLAHLTRHAGARVQEPLSTHMCGSAFETDIMFID